MAESISFPRKFFIGLGVSAGLAVLLLLVLFFLEMGGDDGAPPGGDAEPAGAVPVVLEETAGQEASPEESGQEALPEEVPQPVAEEESRPALLEGRVLGEEGGIADARVLLFAVPDIEDLARRLGRFDTSGIPDLSLVFGTIRDELERFRQSGKETRTDREGKYAFHDVEPVAYFVLTLAPGRVFRYGDVVSLSRDRTEVLDLWLDRGAVISGRVVDASGEAVAGVVVTAVYHPPGMAGVGEIVQKLLRYVNGEFLKGPFQSRTDGAGSFLLDSLPPGVYDLLARKEGLPEARLDAVATGTTEAVIQLHRGVRVEGVLVNRFGLPVPDVTVRLLPNRQPMALPFPGAKDIATNLNRLLGEREHTAASGEDGVVRIPDVGPGPYRLEIKSAGFLPLEKPLEVPRDEETLSLGSLRLDAGEAITGRVRAAGGAPVGGARVSAYPEGMSLFTMGGAIDDLFTGRNEVTSDSSGHFRLGGLSAGRYRVLAQAGGFGGALRGGVTAGEDPLELVLEPGIPVAGHVVDDETGRGMPAAEVCASGVLVTTGEEGEFLLEGVTPRDSSLNPFEPPRAGRRSGDGGPRRTIRIKATADGFEDASRDVPLDEVGAGVTISLRRRAQVHGVTLDPEGQPLPGVLVRLTPGEEIPFLSDGTVFVDIGVSNLEGKFRLESPEREASFQILASHPLYASTSVPAFPPGDPDATGPVEVRLAPGGTIRGVVTDGEQAIAGARLRLAKSRQVSGEMQFMSNLLGLPKQGQLTHSSSTGEFRYQRVHPGEYVLTAEVSGFGDARSETIRLAAGETREVDIVMDRGGEIAGAVVDAEGFPLAGARVRVLREGGLDREMLEAQRVLGGAFKGARSDEAGQFRVAGLPAGTYTVIAAKKGYSRAEVTDLRPDLDEPLQLVLPAEARIRGSVVDAVTGAPIPRFELRITEPDATSFAPDSEFRPWQEVRDSDGRFFRDGLAGGECELEVKAPAHVPETRKISLAPGEDRPVTFALEPAGRLVGRALDAETGRPIAGVRIGVAAPRKEAGEEGGDEADPGDPSQALQGYFEEVALRGAVYTEDDGTFVVESFPVGPRTVVAAHDDFVHQYRENLVVELGEEREQQFRLQRGLSVSGRVVDERGDAVTGFVLLEGPAGEKHPARKGIRADVNGKFRVSGLLKGRHRLIIPGRGPGTAPLTRTIDLEEDVEDLEIVIPASPGG